MTRRKIITSIMATILVLGAVFLYALTHYGPGGMSDFSAKIAGDYFIHRNSSHEIFIAPDSWDKKTPVIPAKVIECNFDKRFIIAKRQGLKQRSTGNPNDTYEVPDPNIFDYWILDTTGPKLFGPLTLSEFEYKRKELGVPASLSLKNVYTFRPLFD